MPSLVDLEGTTSSAFMQAANTWPATRINILEQTRTLLNDRFATVHSRNIPHLDEWFYDLETIGSGAFGTVYSGCVRAWDAANAPKPRCVKYDLRGLGAGDDTTEHDIFLVIKAMKPLDADVALLKNAPYAGHNSDFTSWVGEENSVREVVMGRLLNLLVVHDVTPHFPLIYEPFHIVDSNRSAFAMELAHMSFANFMSSKILASLDAVNVIQVLDVAILQLCNGLLCAHKHYDFRHNDFHAQNAMMTFITDTTYSYKVAGSYYDIPNYGMCWKLIDFGYSASRVFDKDDLAHSAMHSPALSVAYKYFDLTDHAMEFFDMLRLVSSSLKSTDALRSPTKETVNARLDEYVALMKELAVASDKRGSIQIARAAYVANTKRVTSKLVRATPEFSNLMHTSGLLEQLFARLAERFKVSSPAGVVFDANASPFADGDIVLEGIDNEPIVVTEAIAESLISPGPTTGSALGSVPQIRRGGAPTVVLTRNLYPDLEEEWRALEIFFRERAGSDEPREFPFDPEFKRIMLVLFSEKRIRELAMNLACAPCSVPWKEFEGDISNDAIKYYLKMTLHRMYYVAITAPEEPTADFIGLFWSSLDEYLLHTRKDFLFKDGMFHSWVWFWGENFEGLATPNFDDFETFQTVADDWERTLYINWAFKYYPDDSPPNVREYIR